MTITVFTSNQARHASLIERLAGIADRVYAVQECNTVFPGEVADFFAKSELMQEYFSHVLRAEREVFGRPRFAPPNVRTLPIKMGDLNRLSLDDLAPALQSDHYVVFGASFIKGALIDHLVAHRALNIHMGVSPYYRGSSCNFWALVDRRPDLVGATIHRLTKGLDSGPMLFHALPAPRPVDGFTLGMLAVRAAHEGLAEALAHGTLDWDAAVKQDKSLELRYTRNADFHDGVVEPYLKNLMTPDEIHAMLLARDLGPFLRPHVA